MPATVSLGTGFVILYYAFLALTLILAASRLCQSKHRILSMISAIAVILVYPAHAALSLGRPEGMHEFQGLLHFAGQWHVVALLVCATYLFLLLWWGMFFHHLWKSCAKKGT